MPPLDILTWCTGCLAAMSAIRHLLVSGRVDPIADRRREVLRRLLNNPDLTNVATPKVRDSWEHLDERLDKILPQMETGSISHVYVAAKPPHSGTITLKRFDPVDFVIYFVDEGIPLRPAAREIANLKVRLEEAMRTLSREIVRPWG